MSTQEPPSAAEPPHGKPDEDGLLIGKADGDEPTGGKSDGDEPAGGGRGRHGRAEPGRRRRGRRLLIAALVFVLIVVLGLGGLAFQRQSSYNSNIDRIPGVMPTNTDRPGPSAVGSENWLLVGSDTETTTTGQGAQISKARGRRSDTLMILHLPADRKNAYVVSIPRDSWVEVPGYGNQKINAAFSFGGPSLLIETVESLTGIRIDHFGAIDFGGFKAMTDAVGGVDVNVAQTVSDPRNHVTWQAGKQHLNGEKALLFVRQRYNLPNGDFDRIKRQQAFLRALAKKAADGGTVSNPLKLDRFLKAFTKSISVDDSVSAGDLRSLALSLRGLRPQNVRFLTVPNKGSAQRGKQSVVLLDQARAAQLYEAVRTDEAAGYVKRFGGTNSVGTVS